MKLKFYNPETTPATPAAAAGKPVVCLSKSGKFSFNLAAAQVLGLKPTSTIHVMQDEAAPVDWYLIVDESQKKGFPVSSTRALKTGAAGGYIFKSLPTARALLSSVGEANGRTRFPLATVPEIIDSPTEKGVKLNAFAILTLARK